MTALMKYVKCGLEMLRGYVSGLRPPSRLMTRSILVAFVVFSYCLLTIFMLSNMQHDCLSAVDLAHELNRLQTSRPPNVTVQKVTQGRVEISEESKFWQDSEPVEKLLGRDYLPNTVFYIWCGKRWFEFPHYLSVKRTIDVLRPDTLIFFYEDYPVTDYWLYNTWFTELTEEYPFLRAHKLEAKDNSCLENEEANLNFAKQMLALNGGIYVQNLTILTNVPKDYKTFDVIDALTPDGYGFLMAKKRALTLKNNMVEFNSNIRKKNLDCVHVTKYTKNNANDVGCIYQTESLFPKDIWNLNNTFGNLARKIFHGSEEIKKPKKSQKTLVPNIAHIVWLGGGYMDFLFYLCVLSLLNVAKVEAVYLHGDGPPSGEYWELLKNHERLHLIHREHPGTVFGTPVNVVSHVTDIWRVDFMIKYGGIYVDTDVIFTKPLDEYIRSFDAVATYDWTYWNHPFPDTINFGVSIGKRNAKFWHRFQNSMKWFLDRDWAWNGLRRPYKILEKHPDELFVDPHFSVTCFRSLCHPTWWPDYHNENVHHANSPSIKNWREDVYAFHWTLPTPFELLNHTTLLSSKSLFAEIGMNVLEKSGMVDYFKRLSRKGL